MHISGKILAFVTLLLGVGGLALGSKATQIRGRWLESIQKREAELQKSQQLVSENSEKLNQLTAELRRTLLPWDRYWNVQAALQNPATGEVQALMGTSRGVKENMSLQGFVKQADGSFLYCGQFKVRRVNEANSVLEPDWRYRPEEGQTWQGREWRFWTLIPVGHLPRFVQLEDQFVRADQLFKERTNELDRQKKLLETASAQLALRVGEINGFDDLKGRTLPPEMIDGYLSTLVAEEELRNTLVVEVDRLRRELLETNQRIESTITDNTRLEAALTGENATAANRKAK
jgi:hypothetical protein